MRRNAGLVAGLGLRENVREMYCTLSRLYRGDPQDHVFLMGFSRGAFTVRALAGLLHRCGLPPAGDDDPEATFDRAWALYEPMRLDRTAVRDFRQGQRDCPVLFMGLWDTVKSYGGLRPIRLPHLRHNPIVENVRHALALDERRAWFQPTTWGRLDNDREHAMTRVPEDDRKRIEERQKILEVWFAGCHSDVGGGLGDGPDARSDVAPGGAGDTPRIALRWMLREAVDVNPGLLLNEVGRALLEEGDPAGPPRVHQSWGPSWRAVEMIPRREIHNDGVWPTIGWGAGSADPRRPAATPRGPEGVCVHGTAARTRQVDFTFTTIETKGPPATP